jgi:hypothetical protein
MDEDDLEDSEETTRPGRNRSIKAYLVTDDDDDCGQPPDILWEVFSDCFELVCNIIKILLVPVVIYIIIYIIFSFFLVKKLKINVKMHGEHNVKYFWLLSKYLLLCWSSTVCVCIISDLHLILHTTKTWENVVIAPHRLNHNPR